MAPRKAKVQTEIQIGEQPPKISEQQLVVDDELASLMKGDAAAGVSVNVGFNLPFGEAKCSVVVTLTCDQNDLMLERAKVAAFGRAAVFANDGMQEIIELLKRNAPKQE
jgi:hypothetical protein